MTRLYEYVQLSPFHSRPIRCQHRLTGLGSCSHLLSKDVNLATHITDIVKWEDLSNIVLVGHSYGGLIISGTTEQVGDRITSIVCLDAFVPENGESLSATASQPVKDAVAAALIALPQSRPSSFTRARKRTVRCRKRSGRPAHAPVADPCSARK